MNTVSHWIVVRERGRGMNSGIRGDDRNCRKC